jgi:hypothetical protein
MIGLGRLFRGEMGVEFYDGEVMGMKLVMR